MSNVKLNINKNNNDGNNKKLKLNTNKNNSTKEESSIKNEVNIPSPEELGVPIAPKIEEIKEEEIDNLSDAIINKEDLEIENKGKRKKKNKKNKSKNNKKKNKKESKPKTIEEEYKSYRTRKILVITVMILFILSLIFFGTYNTFFKHIPTYNENATATNKYNNQTQMQQWDTGVDGYLNANLYNIMKNNVNLGSGIKDFTVEDISVEKNEQLNNDIIMTFFSANITAAGVTNRVFFSLPLMIENSHFVQAGSLEMSMRQPFSYDYTTVVENPLLTFSERPDENASKEFEKVLENFLTLGYNSKQDVSNIYKGKTALDFVGTFTNIISCTVYPVSNELGCNAYVSYELELPNKIKYVNTAYMSIESTSGGSYIINKII